MDHAHHSCAHNALKFCGHCNTVWCQTCKVEWRQNPICLLNHYPTWPNYTTYAGPTTSFGTSLGGSITNAPTPNITLTACAHGDD